MPSEDEARNVAPRNGAFWVYLSSVTAAGIALISVMLMRLTTHDFASLVFKIEHHWDRGIQVEQPSNPMTPPKFRYVIASLSASF